MFHCLPNAVVMQPLRGGTGRPGTLLGGILFGNGLLPMTELLCNYTAGGAPGSGNDISQGYSVGSQWVGGGNFYVCVSNAVGAAVWAAIVGGTGTVVYSGQTAVNTGSATTVISNVNVRTGSIIVASYVGADQWPLSLGPIVNATSFAINFSAIPPGGFINWHFVQ